MKRIIALFSCLLWLEANAATPSYSNFSSNQFSPSGTYTVTVKNQPKLTNIIEHAQLSLTNPAFANSLVYITNMTGTNGITNGMVFVSTYGKKIQFAWMTNGIGSTNISMVISNGLLGICRGNPSFECDVNGTVRASTAVNADVYQGTGSASPVSLNVGRADFINSGFNINGTTDGKTRVRICADGTLMICAVATQSVTNENATNTVLISQGTNLYIGDGITANSSNVATMQFSFQTSGTPVMVISNGLVGIGKANPTVPLDVVGSISGSSGLNLGGTITGPASFNIAATGNGRLVCVTDGIWRFKNNLDTAFDRMVFGTLDTNGFSFSFQNNTNLVFIGDGIRSFSGAGIALTAMYQDPFPYGSSTNTLLYSDGNALHITDSTIIHSNVFPITANFGNMKPCGCVTWVSNFTCYMICTNSADGNATTNKLGGL